MNCAGNITLQDSLENCQTAAFCIIKLLLLKIKSVISNARVCRHAMFKWTQISHIANIQIQTKYIYYILYTSIFITIISVYDAFL